MDALSVDEEKWAGLRKRTQLVADSLDLSSPTNACWWVAPMLDLLDALEQAQKDTRRLDALDGEEIPLDVKLEAWETSDGTSRSAADAILAQQEQAQ